MRNMEVYITGMDRGCLSSREVSHTSLEWTDGNTLAGSFPYFGRKIKPSPKWTDGCPSSREVSHTSMEWTDGDALAGSFPYFREMKPSMQSQVARSTPKMTRHVLCLLQLIQKRTI